MLTVMDDAAGLSVVLTHGEALARTPADSCLKISDTLAYALVVRDGTFRTDIFGRKDAYPDLCATRCFAITRLLTQAAFRLFHA